MYGMQLLTVVLVKPEWKVRTAPKLPPKEPVQSKTSVFAKPRIEEIEDAPTNPKKSQKPPSKATGKPAKLAPKK